MAPNRGSITPRTIMAPLAAFTMAGLLFAYTRHSIQAAKVNAAIHREERHGHPSPPRKED